MRQHAQSRDHSHQRPAPSNQQPSGPPHPGQHHRDEVYHRQQPGYQPASNTPTNTMATYERRPPPFPAANGMDPARSSLPPIQSNMAGGREPYGGRALPPIQLPPMRDSPPTSDPPPRRDPNHTMSVTSLLSRNPESPPRARRTPVPASLPPPQAQLQPPGHQDSRPSPNFYGGSPHPGPPPMGPGPPVSHYRDQGARQGPTPTPPAFPAQGYSYTLPRHPAAPSEPDVPHHSPASSYRQSPGCYPPSSEASPTTEVAQPFADLPEMPMSQPPPLNYSLTIRQQPVAARACGYGERDRRVIDPPPILELKVTDKATGAPKLDNGGMLALHCTLLNKDGNEDDTETAQTSPDGPASRRLMGSLVAAPYQAKDEHGTAGTFFVFPDLSCRNPGKYRLKFTLIRINPMQMTPGTKHPTVAHVVTEAFSVYTAKDFPGMRASSGLLVALRRQGLNVGVKKGSDARKVKGKGKAKKGSSGSDDDDEDGDDDGEGYEGGGGNGGRKQSTVSGATDDSMNGSSPSRAKGQAKGKRRRIDVQ